MAVKKKKSKVQDPVINEKIQQVFDDHRKKTGKEDFDRHKKSIIKKGMMTAAAVIVILYLCSSVSRVRAVNVTGTKYLSKEYIQEVSRIQEDNVFFFTIPFVEEMILKNDPMIADAKVTLENGNVIKINITEKKAVGYRYEDSGKILLEDGSEADIKSEYLDIIAAVPYINGFSDAENTRLLCSALGNVDQSMIENISEISELSLSYDAHALKILMRSGGYFLGSYYNLDKLNKYYAIYNNLTDKSYCISASDSNNVAFTMVCPWNQSGSEEYWTDENGNVRTNSYGDAVAKHYYTLSDGATATDENGNPIAIPIDDNGNEVADGDFEANYNAGYYSTGTLVIP